MIYADLECIIEKIDGCRNNPGSSPTTKASDHILSGFSMSTISSFRSTKKKKKSMMYTEVKIVLRSFVNS